MTLCKALNFPPGLNQRGSGCSELAEDDVTATSEGSPSPGRSFEVSTCNSSIATSEESDVREICISVCDSRRGPFRAAVHD